jgi:poly(hydroxyalkanoate) depolymerase family esterase
MTEGANEGRLAEATRLTRAGRLAEATALLGRTSGLGVGLAPAGAVVRVEPGDARAGMVLPPIPPSRGGAPSGGTRRATGRPAWPGRWTAATYEGRHGARSYRLYLPASGVGPGSALVVLLHGCTQDAEDFAIGTRMNAIAEARGWAVAYPEQDAAANPSRCWNWFAPEHQRRDAGEPALIAGIARRVRDEHGLDPGRVFVAGLSAGGAMAAVLAAAYPDVFAAAGVHSGLAPGSARDLPSALAAMRQGGAPGPAPAGTPPPLIVFHGDRDTTVHPRNADAIARQWAAGAGATAPVVLSRDADATRTLYRDASGGLRVERWTVHGAGHAWSGGDRNGSYTNAGGPDASAEMARFFREHARGRG